MKTAFFMENKQSFDSMEAAMEWLIDQAKRFGMTGPEAIERGFADIFDN